MCGSLLFVPSKGEVQMPNGESMVQQESAHVIKDSHAQKYVFRIAKIKSPQKVTSLGITIRPEKYGAI